MIGEQVIAIGFVLDPCNDRLRESKPFINKQKDFENLHCDEVPPRTRIAVKFVDGIKKG